MSLARLEPEPTKAIATLEAMLSHPNQELQFQALEGLADLGERFPQAMDKLREALGSSKKPLRYRSAMYTLRLQSGVDDVSDVLIEMLQSEEDEVREQALRGIDSFVEAGQLPPRIVEALMPILENNHDELRYRAAVILSRLSIESVVIEGVLLEGVQRADDWSTRIACVELLGQSNEYDTRIARTILTGLTDDDNDVRSACAQALAKLGQRWPAATEEVAEMLTRAIEDPAFGEPDRFDQRTGSDYAFDSLWMLITKEEADSYWIDIF